MAGQDTPCAAASPLSMHAPLASSPSSSGSQAGAERAAAESAALRARALDVAAELQAELLGGAALTRYFLPVCRGWFHTAVCHPCAFRSPVEAWGAAARQQLDEHLGRMREPPQEEFEDLRVALEHAEDELRVTALSAAFPSGVTVVLLRHARRASGLLHWLHASPKAAAAAAPGVAPAGAGATGSCFCSPAVGGELAWSSETAAAVRRRYLLQEVEELHRRVALLSRVVAELRPRLPDPELPVRWAEWFEEQGHIVGLPASHCMRYRSQREQVAGVWANNRRTLLSTAEHVEALTECLRELELRAEDATEQAVSGNDEGALGEEASRVRSRTRSCPTAACGSGVVQLCRRLWGEPKPTMLVA